MRHALTEHHLCVGKLVDAYWQRNGGSSAACTREALVEVMGAALDAITAQDVCGFFAHHGYRTY